MAQKKPQEESNLKSKLADEGVSKFRVGFKKKKATQILNPYEQEAEAMAKASRSSICSTNICRPCTAYPSVFDVSGMLARGTHFMWPMLLMIIMLLCGPEKWENPATHRDGEEWRCIAQALEKGDLWCGTYGTVGRWEAQGYFIPGKALSGWNSLLCHSAECKRLVNAHKAPDKSHTNYSQ